MASLWAALSAKPLADSGVGDSRFGRIEGHVAALRRKIEKDEGVIEVLRTHTLRRSIYRL